MSESVLFVGGPWDGDWRTLEHQHRYYDVAVHALGYPYGTKADDRDVVGPCMTRVTYERVPFAGRVFFLADDRPEWERRKDQSHIVERLLARLSEGYRRPLT